VVLARVVLLQPKLILADEPTASLDDAAAAVAAQLLQKSAQASSATLVIASHDARILQFFAAAENTAVLALELKPSGSAAWSTLGDSLNQVECAGDNRDHHPDHDERVEQAVHPAAKLAKENQGVHFL
jgi:ABC-type Mn2+/Zn2+ transport system ATPase subunit